LKPEKPKTCTQFVLEWSGGKPEMVRSSDCFVVPIRLCVAGAETGRTYHFRRPFLWFISFGRTKEMNNLLLEKQKNQAKQSDYKTERSDRHR